MNVPRPFIRYIGALFFAIAISPPFAYVAYQWLSQSNIGMPPVYIGLLASIFGVDVWWTTFFMFSSVEDWRLRQLLIVIVNTVFAIIAASIFIAFAH
ncbi:MAG: hypothetical protein JWO73_243 [Candidatus Taylorbacteria bacterium]|nr:hypothetical protein [Candidatus Taylorbacteria bacterium]